MDKIFDFLKLLIEQTDKVKSNFIFLIRLVLTFLFAEWIYRYFIGSYKFIDLLSYNDWISFVLSGRLLVCLFLVVTTYIGLFTILPIASIIPFLLVSKFVKAPRDFDRQDAKVLRWLLKSLKLLEYDNDRRRMLILENTDILYEYALLFKDPDTKKEIRSLKDSLISDIGHTYFVFVVIYFMVMSAFNSNHFLNSLVIIGFLLIIVFYAVSKALIEILQKLSPELVFLIENAKCEYAIENTLKELGILASNSEIKKFEGLLEFYYNEKRYLVKCIHSDISIPSSIILEYLKIAEKNDAIFILLSKCSLLPKTLDGIGGNSKYFSTIRYTNEGDIASKIKFLYEQEFNYNEVI